MIHLLTSAVKNITATSEYPVVSPVIQIFPMTDLILTSTTCALAPKGVLGFFGGGLEHNGTDR